MAIEYIQVAGKSDLYLAVMGSGSAGTNIQQNPANFTPGEFGDLIKIGEQMDDTKIQVQGYFHDVFGDRHGGPQGPPIERQMLGQIARVQFSLSRWSHEVRAMIQQHNVFATDGAVQDSEVGALMFRDRCFRLLIKNSRENYSQSGDDPFTYNFVCATLSTPVDCGQGSKHSILQFSMEAHRAPEGHPNAGVLWNRDIEGLESEE